MYSHKAIGRVREGVDTCASRLLCRFSFLTTSLYAVTAVQVYDILKDYSADTTHDQACVSVAVAVSRAEDVDVDVDVDMDVKMDVGVGVDVDVDV